jgi:hypothetical protein
MSYSVYDVNLPESPAAVVFVNGFVARDLAGFLWMWQKLCIETYRLKCIRSRWLCQSIFISVQIYEVDRGAIGMTEILLYLCRPVLGNCWRSWASFGRSNLTI